ncbi:MAG: MBL fold metallo-hydrolase [Bacteroidales bacterium]|nr:MBL fold metallo-hydrolase [Bacteroidales bacterium]
MKRLLTVILLLLLCVNLGAFDWPFQSNSELRGEMLEFAGGMAARQKGTAEGRLISRFVRKEARKAAKDSLAWISDTYELTMKLKEMCPPHVDDGSRAAALRRDIMLLEDYPIHVDNRSANASHELKKAFDAFSDRYRSEARAKALECLEGPGPAEGELQVIKIYNMGYLLRTAQRMIVVDVFWDGTEEEAARIASKADAFFLSHPHRDHWNPVMVDALAAAGATLVLPAVICPMHGNKLVADSEWREPRDVRGIKVLLLRGNQGPQPNNAYLIEFDGWRVLIPGENDESALYEPFSAYQAPDLILHPTWNGLGNLLDIVRAMPGYDASKVSYIPGHDNEICFHGVDHRESYREMFSRKDRLGDPDAVYPKVILEDIGECVTLDRK